MLLSPEVRRARQDARLKRYLDRCQAERDRLAAMTDEERGKYLRDQAAAKEMWAALRAANREAKLRKDHEEWLQKQPRRVQRFYAIQEEVDDSRDQQIIDRMEAEGFRYIDGDERSTDLYDFHFE